MRRIGLGIISRLKETAGSAVDHSDFQTGQFHGTAAERGSEQQPGHPMARAETLCFLKKAGDLGLLFLHCFVGHNL